jgi:hypothetical protein
MVVIVLAIALAIALRQVVYLTDLFHSTSTPPAEFEEALGGQFQAGQARDSCMSYSALDRVLCSPRVPALVIVGCLLISLRA